MKNRPSTRNRLTLIAATAVAVVAVSVGVLAWIALRETLIEQADRELRAMTRGPIENIMPDLMQAMPPPALENPQNPRIQVRSTDGKTGAIPRGVTPLPWTPADQQVADGTSTTAGYTTESGGQRLRVLTFRGRQGQAIQVARSLAGADATLNNFGMLIGVLAAGAVTVAAVAGRLVARDGLRPVDRLTEAAARIAETRDLSQPIAVTGHDEVAQLGRAFNRMLEALDASRRQQRELIEDAAHELRTPMASMRTNIELLVHAGRLLGEQDRTDLLGDLERQSAELAALVSNLVDLARSRNADEPFTPTDLTDLAAEALGLAQAHFPRSRFLLSAPVPITVAAQPAALTRALVNLLDNAAKFGPPEQEIEVRLRAGDDAARVSVLDRCPTIDAPERERIFRRFHRGDTARSVPGSGLGLAIVHQTATAHGGGIEVAARPGGGNSFDLTLPLYRCAVGGAAGVPEVAAW